MQRAALGCKVDGGRYKMGSYTHTDAEVIAATVAGMPDSMGAKRMAIRVAELARAGMTPDWMPGAVPRCVPVEMKRNRHGDHAVTKVVGTERIRTRGPTVRGTWKTVEVRACPVRFSPDPEQIEAARRAYDDWWLALDWVRDGLIARRDVARGGGDGSYAEVEAVEGAARVEVTDWHCLMAQYDYIDAKGDTHAVRDHPAHCGPSRPSRHHR